MGNSIFGKHPLTVFKVVEPDQAVLPLWNSRANHAMLCNAAFSSIADSLDSKSVGFVTLENHRATNFGPHNVDFHPYHVFSLRIDERKVPPAALEDAVAEAIEKAQAEIDADTKSDDVRFKLTKDRKREIRTQVRLRMLSRMPAVPKVVDIVWNGETGLIYVCDKSPGVLDLFQGAFTKCFAPHLTLREFDIHDIVPGDTVPSGFLSWLYGRRDADRRYASGETVMLARIEDRIEIALDGETVKAVAKSDEFPEIDAGLDAGKSVSRADVRIEDTDFHVFTLDVSDVLTVNNMSGPEVVKPTDDEELAGAIYEAAANVECGFNLFCSLVSCWAEQELHTGIVTTRISDKVVDMLASSAPLEKAAQRLVDSVKGANATMTITTGSGKSVTIGKNAA